jgi:dipeptidyl aminopeptidase/acylaminoacyl peptidase
MFKGSIKILVLLLYMNCSFGSKVWPFGTTFIALTEGEWRLYVVTDRSLGPEYVSTEVEPRSTEYSAINEVIAYFGSDGSMREVDLITGKERVLAKPDDNISYTQPEYGQKGEDLFVVELINGNSQDTDLGVISKDGNHYRKVVSQRSAQFEPFFKSPNTLYYSNVHCALGCSQIIQEIWRINILTKEAEQLTLLNAMSRQPKLSHDQKWIYFSSNKAGNYHIWRMNLETKEYQQLTEGNVTDVDPSLDSDGHLYFIRRSPTGTKVLQLSSKGKILEMGLPDLVSDVRDMEINQ